MTFQSEWTYVIAKLHQTGSTHNPILAELPFKNVNFTSTLNSIGSFSGDLLLSGFNSNTNGLNLSQLLAPGYSALYVLNQGNAVWGGVIWGREWNSETQTLTVNANEMLSYFQHRRIDSSLNSTYAGVDPNKIAYTNKDALYIVHDLMTYANGCTPNGNIGLVYAGASTSGTSISRTYFNFELKSIYQAWKDLAAGVASGSGSGTNPFFDFIIQPSVGGGYVLNQLITGAPTIGKTYDATSQFSTNLQFPGNIVSYKYSENGATMANYLYGLGYGANGSKLISQRYAGNLLSGGTFPHDYPLLQDTVNYTDVQSSTLLGQLTAGKLSATAVAPTTLEVVVPTYVDPNFDPTSGLSYGLGDEVLVTITDDNFPLTLQDVYRIVSINAMPGDNGPDRVTLTLNLPLQSNIN